MKLYYAPGACSIGIHVLLEEIGKPYELAKLNLMQGDQYGAAFTSVNPKSKVPTLERPDGSVLTEFGAIAFWLAAANPEASLYPADIEARTQATSLIDYVVATVHMQGFGRLFRPGNFGPREEDQDAVKQRGREIVDKAFRLIDSRIAGKEYAVGPFSIADAALFYVEFWASKRMNIELPGHCAAHYERMIGRPSVQRVLKDEGFA
ncbi:glutathione S-transferase family protein [Chelatococcus reniformis]|uniref:Glutathione S-transferase n=1 Tax=Chelatococcus reniformis TaxID=1494448 RepID=A0A916US15_9HYPH|nr:glutathione S-transferase C-terminal domain-containing protein [Chelatococcus reniformis]GGC84113.1 glutathione S-transferase [Chelatococcus reniformis]